MTFHRSAGKSPPPLKKTAFCYYECILRKETSLLAPSHKNRHENIHPHRQTYSFTLTHRHTHTHASTTKVLSLKWTSIRGRERCCHWGQKIAGDRYLDNTFEAKTVKNMDVNLFQACACMDCVATHDGGLWERK